MIIKKLTTPLIFPHVSTWYPIGNSKNDRYVIDNCRITSYNVCYTKLLRKQIKTAGFILKPDSPEIKPLFEKIKGQFELKGINVLLSEHSAAMIGIEGLPFEQMCELV